MSSESPRTGPDLAPTPLRSGQLKAVQPGKLAAVVTAVVDGLLLRRIPLHQVAYGLWAAAATLWVVATYFAAMRHQLFFAEARSGVIPPNPSWSAPLDDVFIHFDFARSAAQGAPFEWSQGNGYSSGGTSLLYPLVLALGFHLGYLGGELMLWAGILAFFGVWVLLLCSSRLVDGLPAWTAFILPPALLSVGALNWSLASGMEIAFFLGVWGVCYLTWERTLTGVTSGLTGTARRPLPRLFQHAAALGTACLVLVATRPEAAVLVACFALSLWAAVVLRLKDRPLRARWLPALATLLLAASPGAALVLGQGLANEHFTGNFSAAGALVKLELHHPYMTTAEVVSAWWSHLEYQVLRVTDYHFSAFVVRWEGTALSLGWVVWLLALVPLRFRATRRACLLLWASLLCWMMVTALNGQVRWQNERYAMPAVAWLLLNAGVGIAALLSRVSPLEIGTLRRLPLRRPPLSWAVAAFGLLAATSFALGQSPRYRDQVWFFGRAARNIHEQHVQVAKRLSASPSRPRRVLLGDAGAIPYVSELPALDIIGLGGYHDYPFAQATRQGVGAAIELIQRLPDNERPDLMALYPGWWGDLPSWFGTKWFEVPVRGNVICGGPSKVVYHPDWTALADAAPFWLQNGEQLAELDVADLISERQSGLTVQGAPGFIQMKMLPHPTSEQHDLWDAGRLIPAEAALEFEFTQAQSGKRWVVALLAPDQAAELQLQSRNRTVGAAKVAAQDGWRLTKFPLDADGEQVPLRLRVVQGEVVIYHLWLLTRL